MIISRSAHFIFEGDFQMPSHAEKIMSDASRQRPDWLESIHLFVFYLKVYVVEIPKTPILHTSKESILILFLIICNSMPKSQEPENQVLAQSSCKG